MIVYSSGCHSGYNVVGGHKVPGLTLEPNWPQAAARKGALLIAGTGYQYGDTDLMEYSERLYLSFTKRLRAAGPVAIGTALVQAKQDYLADTAVEIDGVVKKTLLISALFGLPMLSVDMPGAPSIPPNPASEVTGLTPVPTPPGDALGLLSTDITLTTVVTPTLKTLNTPALAAAQISAPSATLTATYYRGKDGFTTRPGQLILPLDIRNVTAPGGPATEVLRGVGFLGGSYTDVPGIMPLASVPATEMNGVHPVFRSNVFYPIAPWNLNYYSALADPVQGPVRLMLMPAQYKSSAPDSLTGTMRLFDTMSFRLFYSHNLDAVALGAAPSIAQVGASSAGGDVTFRTHVTDPVSDVQKVWVTYTALSGPLAGAWQSLDLTRDLVDQSLWTGLLNLGGATQPADLRYMVQAANGVGLVALVTNQGEYFTPDIDPGRRHSRPDRYPQPQRRPPPWLWLRRPAVERTATASPSSPILPATRSRCRARPSTSSWARSASMPPRMAAARQPPICFCWRYPVHTGCRQRSSGPRRTSLTWLMPRST